MRAAHRNHDCRLRDFLWRGRRCISIENETLRAVFCADKGSDLIELLHPWYARLRLIALEPVCDLPSVAQAAGRGTAIQLAPGATRQTRIEATTFIPAAPVSAVAWGGQIQQ